MWSGHLLALCMCCADNCVQQIQFLLRGTVQLLDVEIDHVGVNTCGLARQFTLSILCGREMENHIDFIVSTNVHAPPSGVDYCYAGNEKNIIDLF